MAKEKAPNSRRANPEEWGVLTVRCSDEGCGATQKLDFFRSHQVWVEQTGLGLVYSPSPFLCTGKNSEQITVSGLWIKSARLNTFAIRGLGNEGFITHWEMRSERGKWPTFREMAVSWIMRDHCCPWAQIPEEVGSPSRIIDTSDVARVPWSEH